MDSRYWKGAVFGAALVGMTAPGVASLYGLNAGLLAGLGVTLALGVASAWTSLRKTPEVA